MTTHIRLLIVLLLVTAAPGAAQDANRGGPDAVERFSQTVRLARGGTLRLSNVAGDIVVTGGGGDEVRIDAVKRARGRTEADARAQLDAMRIVVRESGQRLEVRVEQTQRTRGGEVSFMVSLPRDANLDVRTVSGDLQITDVRGEVLAESVSGDIVASGAPRMSSVRSVSGDIQLANVGAEGELRASTVSGDLVTRGLKARSLALESVSGDMWLENVEAERARLNSVSGEIRYTGTLARTGRYEMQSHSGNIDLVLSGNTGFGMEARTFSGRLRSDFPLPPVEPDGRRTERTVRITVGDASASLILQSFSGNIEVRRR